MSSTSVPKEKPPISSAPTRLTPSEIESLRAHKRELHRRFAAIDAGDGEPAKDHPAGKAAAE